MIEECVDASGNADRQFTWGTRYIDDLVMRTLYALTDITYDVVALIDTTGLALERFLYDPYGKSTALDANFALDSDGISDYDWEYRFTSREFDKGTGLDYFRARYYSSGQGRFVNHDPIGYPDGMNAYAGYFVPNNVDPNGKAKVECTYSRTRYYVNWALREKSITETMTRIADCGYISDPIKCCEMQSPGGGHEVASANLLGAGPDDIGPSLCESAHYTEMCGLDCVACCI